MKIPQDYIDDLLDKVPLAQVAEHFVGTMKRDGPNRLTACCPMHTENTPSFKVDTQDNHFYCYGCNEGGNALNLVQSVKNFQFPEAVRWLAKEFGFPEPPSSKEAMTPEMKRKGVYRWAHSEAKSLFADQLWSPAGAAARQYLLDRGFNKETLVKYGVGLNSSHEAFMSTIGKKFNWGTLEECGLLRMQPNKHTGRSVPRPAFLGRITFPIQSNTGQCVGFGARIISGDGPKYINTSETPIYRKSLQLYGLKEAIEGTASPEERRLLRVTEGYLDVLASDQHGLGRTVATCGTAMTSDQVGQCFRYADHLILYFDGDRAGRRAAMKACETILPYVNGDRKASVALLPEGHDLDSLLQSVGAERIRELEQRAVPLSHFMVQHLESLHPPTSAENKALIHRTLSRTLESAKDESFRSVFMAEIEGRYAGVTAEPNHLELAQSYKARVPEKAKALIDASSKEVLDACATLCAKPFWQKLLADPPSDLTAVEKNLWDFCLATAERANKQDIPAEEVFTNDYRYLVMYFNSMGNAMTEEDRVVLLATLSERGPSESFFLTPEVNDEPTRPSIRLSN